MGFGFVLFVWIVIGSSAVALLAIFLSRRYFTLTPFSLGIAATIAVACIVWTAAVFAMHAIVNEAQFDRAMGISDTAFCPLVGDYSLAIVDRSTRGTIVRARGRAIDPALHTANDAILAVHQLEIVGARLIGETDETYFILDSDTAKRRDFSSEAEFLATLTGLHMVPHLEPVEVIFNRQSFGWFDLVTVVVYIVPPMFALAFFIRNARRWREPTNER